MKATINGIVVEGTPMEIYELMRRIKEWSKPGIPCDNFQTIVFYTVSDKKGIIDNAIDIIESKKELALGWLTNVSLKALESTEDDEIVIRGESGDTWNEISIKKKDRNIEDKIDFIVTGMRRRLAYT